MSIWKLVNDVKEGILSSNPDLISLIKKTRVIATYFNDEIFLNWLDLEFHGYFGFLINELPEYRQGTAKLPMVPEFRKEFNRNLGINLISQDNKSKLVPFAIFFSIEQIMDYRRMEQVKLSYHLDGSDLPIQLPKEQLNLVVRTVSDKITEYIVDIDMKNKDSYEFNEPLMNIFNKFHLIATDLTNKRHGQRITITIQDEYDVQDLLRALLSVDYIIGKEEFTSKFAGKTHRIDFLVLNQDTGIEVKYVSSNNKQDIADQISADKDGYSQDTRIRNLYFFIYDPNFYIKNRQKYIEDLEKNIPENFKLMRVIIKPEFS